MPDHHFNPTLAKDYGIDIAVFLNNLYHWVEYNRAYKKNFFEGRYWTFNSIAAFCEVHPYWSKRQIERIISACKNEGLILSGCFNKDKRDRTAWYTLSDEAMAYFEDTPKVDGCISPNGEMHDTERGNSFPQTVTTIPINKPINKPIKKQDTPYSPPEGDAPARKNKYALQENAKPILRAYVGSDQELALALADFIQLREQKQAINSATAIKALLKKLDELSGGDRAVKLQLINESIANSWKSVFPLRQSGGRRDLYERTGGNGDSGPGSSLPGVTCL